jgi:hypothetical protein
LESVIRNCGQYFAEWLSKVVQAPSRCRDQRGIIIFCTLMIDVKIGAGRVFCVCLNLSIREIYGTN